MDMRDGQSFMDLRRQNSTRRYTYEGYGGQKHDKTLILHKSENCSNDTIVLRLCKRLGGRISWSSCFKGKLLLATLLALMAIFCYLNLFSAYLPKTCHVFAIRSSRKLRSLQDSENEPAVFVRTEKTFSEINFDFNPELSRRKRGDFSTFTRQVILNMKERTFAATFMKYSKTAALRLSTVMKKQLPITPLPATKTMKLSSKLAEYPDESLSGVEKTGKVSDDVLLTRIIKSGKSVGLN